MARGGEEEDGTDGRRGQDERPPGRLGRSVKHTRVMAQLRADRSGRPANYRRTDGRSDSGAPVGRTGPDLEIPLHRTAVGRSRLSAARRFRRGAARQDRRHLSPCESSSHGGRASPPDGTKVNNRPGRRPPPHRVISGR